MKTMIAVAAVVTCLAASSLTVESQELKQVDEAVLAAALEYVLKDVGSGRVGVDPTITGTVDSDGSQVKLSAEFRTRINRSRTTLVEFARVDSATSDCRDSGPTCRLPEFSAFVKLGIPRKAERTTTVYATVFRDRSRGGLHMRTLLLTLESRDGAWTVTSARVFAET